MSQRASWWSITINNPTDADRSKLQSANWPTWVKSFSGQEEVGKKGTLHIQGALNTAQIRFSAIKTWLGNDAHIEAARDKTALLKYVQKSDTAVAGTFKSESKEYLTMDKALKKLVQYHESASEELAAALKWERVAIDTSEYWAAVNKLLTDDTTLVQLYTNPQMLRAWVNTKNVWLKYKTDASADGSNEASGRQTGTEVSHSQSAIEASEGAGQEDDSGHTGNEV